MTVVPTAPTPAQEAGLLYVHWGRFSGSAPSLATALEGHGQVHRLDLMAYGREPRLVGARGLAAVEAARAGRGVPWSRTRAWSAALQRRLEREGRFSPGRPVLFVQTLPAFDLPPSAAYAVYTDRTATEGARDPAPFTSRHSRAWLERERRFLRGAQKVFVMGPSTAASLQEDYGVDPDRVAIVGAGPNMVLGPPRQRDACRRLLFVGTQWDLKGGPVLLEAFRELRRRHPDLELLVVGTQVPGDVPEGVRVLGRVPAGDLDAIYDQADLLVHPTHREAFGIVLAEALVKGLPCVHTTVGNQSWIVAGAGVGVAPGDPTALARALEAVVSAYPSFHRRALERGGALRETMTWASVAASIHESWQRSPGGSARPRPRGPAMARTRFHGVLVTYHRPRELRDTLRHLAAQDRPLDRLVVVDNGDDDQEVLAREAYTAAGSLQYLRAPENLGPAGGIALGMRHVLESADDRDWIVVLDDDDPPTEPGQLAGLADFAAAMSGRDPRTAAVGSVGARFDLRRGRLVRPDDDELAGPVPVDYIGGNQLPTYAVASVRSVGPTATELFFGFDDLEYGLRLRRAGYSLYADGDLWLRLRAHLGRLGARDAAEVPPDPPWRRYYATRNLIWILRDHRRPWTAVRVTLLAGLARVLVDTARRPGTGGRTLRLGWRAVRDGWTGRLGRRLEPS